LPGRPAGSNSKDFNHAAPDEYPIDTNAVAEVDAGSNSDVATEHGDPIIPGAERRSILDDLQRFDSGPCGDGGVF